METAFPNIVEEALRQEQIPPAISGTLNPDQEIRIIEAVEDRIPSLLSEFYPDVWHRDTEVMVTATPYGLEVEINIRDLGGPNISWSGAFRNLRYVGESPER